jgi:hypothetical protein
MAPARAPSRLPPRCPFCGQHLAWPRHLPYARASPTHAIARAFTRHRTGSRHQQRRHADVAAPTPATTSPRRPPPSDLRPFEPSNPRGFLEVIPFWPDARAPWSFAAGEIIPRRRFSSQHFVKHPGSQVKHGYCFVHRGPHPSEAVANPPGSAAARPFPSRPHAGLHRAEPHGLPTGSPSVANRGQATRRAAGGQAAPDPGIRCGWICIRGLNVFLFSENLFYL